LSGERNIGSRASVAFLSLSPLALRPILSGGLPLKRVFHAQRLAISLRNLYIARINFFAQHQASVSPRFQLAE
jgi:hypothetical protein